ncbi:peptidoglycan editing factor PgeF [Neobacillus dielmonensis]|uniref:peptidoglycan editing factor PgeF n=1 Tax=Neobacillus dielmonensis TaxID=1347369 RepID=UPI0005A7DC23|nr:peptidoglycan editing factor PgeF [Neobacillus dielmonensis]
MEPFALHNPSYLSIENWLDQYPDLVVGMTTKHGGSSKGYFESFNMGFHVGDSIDDVLKNRLTLSAKLKFPLNCWVGAEQTHDIKIKKVTRQDRGLGADSYQDAFRDTDGFYTNEAGILLTLCFADCVPLYFIAPKFNMVGLAHAGWKGTVHEIGKHMVQAWGTEGIGPEEIHAVIGPCICEECYIVDNRVVNLVENILEDVDDKPYNLISDGQYSLNLRQLNRQILLKAGVLEENILTTGYCTSCDNLFFSHRKDLGKTGRMLSFIGRKEI